MKDFFYKATGQKPIYLSSVPGGDINEAYKIVTTSNTYFAKVNSSPIAKDMFEKEALGLQLLKEKSGINVPVVLSSGTIKNKSYLLLNWIEQGKANNDTNKNLAVQLALLHKVSNSFFGLDHNNYIGNLPQKNKGHKNWLEFYFSNRIELQIEKAINSNLIHKKYIRKTELMFVKIESDYPKVIPSLLHGDLWSGNYIINNNGKVVFIDPAIYYGCREMDIAMMKLFGGFANEVFNIYNELFPLDYQWQSRLKFHQLYYILVHVNLFGGSYISSAQSIIDYYY